VGGGERGADIPPPPLPPPGNWFPYYGAPDIVDMHIYIYIYIYIYTYMRYIHIRTHTHIHTSIHSGGVMS